MTNNEIHSFMKKIVETGTKNKFTLLDGKNHLSETQTMQKLMKESIFVKNNSCGHRYQIAFGDFIESSKICRTCLSTKINPTPDRKTVVYHSQHNTQAI